MNGRTLTQAELLSVWERGEGQRPSRRALALLSGATPDSSAEELALLPVGRRDASLLALRAALFGDELTGLTSCPACGEELELSFGVDEVLRVEDRQSCLSGSGEDDSRLRLAVDGYDVTFRLPATEDLAAIERIADLDAARERLFARCVVRALHGDGEVAASALPAEVIAEVTAAMAQADPQADVQIDADCPACLHRWREPFDIVTFLWTEIAALARRLLGEVHELASAYGWSEREILTLSPARRNAYLEMVR